MHGVCVRCWHRRGCRARLGEGVGGLARALEGAGADGRRCSFLAGTGRCGARRSAVQARAQDVAFVAAVAGLEAMFVDVVEGAERGARFEVDRGRARKADVADAVELHVVEAFHDVEGDADAALVVPPAALFLRWVHSIILRLTDARAF